MTIWSNEKTAMDSESMQLFHVFLRLGIIERLAIGIRRNPFFKKTQTIANVALCARIFLKKNGLYY